MSGKKAREDISVEFKEYHTPSSGIFLKASKQLYKQDSSYQRIEVIENEHFGRVLLLDGLVQTTEKDEFFYHEMLVHPAFLSHPEPRSVLIIGGGDGGVLKEVLRYPVENVCLVEIDPLVIDVSQEYFPWLSPCLKDERTKLIIADGTEFIGQTNKTFDVVCVDSSEPVGPSESLHEEDFYKNMKRCLDSRSVVVAQTGSPIFHQESIKLKNRFLKEIFNVVYFYMSPVPTYPGGSWAFVFLSDSVQPLEINGDPPEELIYFNPDIHRAAFSLPNFFKNELD
jgi:spermidine synthase